MRVIVTGGRDYKDRRRVFEVLDECHRDKPITTIIHGACGWDLSEPEHDTRWLRGADRWADEWAAERGVPVERYLADWTRFRHGAGPRRNAQMVAEASADCVIAFPGNNGTAGMIRLADKAMIHTVVVGPDSWPKNRTP